jgi:hypothetical protein
MRRQGFGRFFMKIGQFVAVSCQMLCFIIATNKVPKSRQIVSSSDSLDNLASRWSAV